MYISKFQLNNYKSFGKSQQIALAQGFNIISGQNNSGKSALLEGLSLGFQCQPHRSTLSMPSPASPLEQRSWADVSLTLTREELMQLVLDFHKGVFYLMIPGEGNTFAARGREFHVTKLDNFVEWFLAQAPYTFELQFSNSNGTRACHQLRLPSYGLRDSAEGKPSGNRLRFQRYRIDGSSGNVPSLQDTVSYLEGQYDLGVMLSETFKEQIYLFHAERRIGRAPVGINTILRPDSQNLAEVLSNLQSHRTRFDKFNDLVRKVLPQITEVSIFNVKEDHKDLEEIRIKTDSTDRYDLARPLSECGTGIGQVLAILYVVFSSTHPRVILVEEPQSFLHPGAVRKLMEVLKTYSEKHQFIISTHSPTVIKSINPSSIFFTKHDGNESNLNPIDIRQLDQIKGLLGDLGVSFSDVFGAEKILWVEGATEENCFPLIIKQIGKYRLDDTIIAGVSTTGDLHGRHKDLVLEIYRKLSSSEPLLPRALGFVFDREGLSEQELTDLKKESKGAMNFLPRRMYENYLLEPKAIAHVLALFDPEWKGTPGGIGEWIEAERQDGQYFKNLSLPSGVDPKQEWPTFIDGSRLLKNLFSHFTDCRVTFEKTTHSVELTKWLIVNQPQKLAELAGWLVRLVQSKP